MSNNAGDFVGFAPLNKGNNLVNDRPGPSKAPMNNQQQQSQQYLQQPQLQQSNIPQQPQQQLPQLPQQKRNVVNQVQAIQSGLNNGASNLSQQPQQQFSNASEYLWNPQGVQPQPQQQQQQPQQQLQHQQNRYHFPGDDDVTVINPPTWSTTDSQADAQSAWEIATKKRPSNATLMNDEGEEENPLTFSQEEDDHQSSTDEEEYANRFTSAKFPSAAEVKRAVVHTLAALEKDHRYLVLGGRQSQCTFEDQNGNRIQEPSLIIKVIDCINSSYVPEEVVKVRLTGVCYEKFLFEKKYLTYKDTDDYFIHYEGMFPTQNDPEKKYHRISVLHGPRGTKRWRIDDEPISNKKRKLSRK